MNNDKYKNVKKRTSFIDLPGTGQLRKSRDSGESEIAVKTTQDMVSSCLIAFEEYREYRKGGRNRERHAERKRERRERRKGGRK